jgi:hypothetical protein
MPEITPPAKLLRLVGETWGDPQAELEAVVHEAAELRRAVLCFAVRAYGATASTAMKALEEESDEVYKLADDACGAGAAFVEAIFRLINHLPTEGTDA